TSLSVSAPARDADGRVPVGVRLLADGAPVRNGFVRLERSTGGAWTYAGRLLTRADGTGSGMLALPGDSWLRATYAGAPTRTASTSATAAVDVDTLHGRSALRSGGVAGSAVLAEAARHVGKPYRYGATGPSTFDCSGFTRYVYARLGKSLPHNSRAQERVTTRVSRAQARPGDLVFIKDVRGHVGIYAGNGRMFDAPRAGKRVSLRRIWTPNHVFGRVA
ncbi:MAG: NlpC/P60 family protein, partial [Actinomycetota bacterium]|nr:NlpC/P60 family protein [Actinomycetota bacterium]